MECRRRTNPPLSYFISIRMTPQSKVRIQLPKLLLKTMHSHGDHDNNSKKCSRKVDSIFTNPFGRSKSPAEKSFSESNDVRRNGSKLRPQKVRLALMSFLARKKKSLNKMMKTETKTNAVHEVGEHKSSGQLSRVPRKLLVPNFRISGKASSLVGRERKMKCTEDRCKNKAAEEITSSVGENELCKKRILMGGKCRPLSSSGTLHYDEDGILSTDILL